SEPALAELQARAYFWRRGWLFQDRERARLSLAPADAASVSVRLAPLAGNPLLLSFSRRDGGLVAVRSPRFDLDFTGARAFRETRGTRPPVLAEIVWSGLPTEEISDAEVGGACGRFPATPAQVPFERTSAGGIAFPARLNGVDLRLALDALADGPLAVSPDAAGKLGLSFARDVYGRLIGSGVRLEIGAFSCAGIHVQELRAPPGDVDGILGGTLLRQAAVGLAPDQRRLAVLGPAAITAPSGSLPSFGSTATSTCPTGGSTSGRRGSNRAAGMPFAPSGSREETGMLKLALLFLVIGLVAALFGFTAIAGASFAIAKF